MDATDDLRILATSQRMLYDVMSILTKEDCKGEPFEIGCRCKSPEMQEQLFDVLNSIFRHTTEVSAVKKPEDYIVCVVREGSPKPEAIGDKSE
jgi:hypothetical protein